MHFKFILSTLMITTSSLLPIGHWAFADDDDDKINEYNQLKDVSEFGEATGKTAAEIKKAREKSIIQLRQSNLDDLKKNLNERRSKAYQAARRHKAYLHQRLEAYRATPAEFSGAHWASDPKFCHEKLGLKKGEILTGKGVLVGVLDRRPNSDKDLTEKERQLFDKMLEARERSDHGLLVRSLITQIAPNISTFLQETSLLRTDSPELPPILNLSFSLSEINHKEKENLQKNVQGKLVVMAWGNFHGNMSKRKGSEQLILEPSVRNNLILVTSVQRDSQLSNFSNRPHEIARDEQLTKILREKKFPENNIQTLIEGARKSFADITLTALGSDVWSFSGTDVPPEQVENKQRLNQGDKTFSKGSGTSFSAPLVTGAAALITELGQKKGVPLSPAEVRWILLHSARKNAIIQGENGRKATFVLPDDEYEQMAKQNSPKSPEWDIKYEKFDAGTYGRGFLDIRRALLLASIYCSVKKDTKPVPQTALEMFNANEKKQDENSSQKILSAFKIAATKKEAKPVPIDEETKKASLPEESARMIPEISE